MSSILARCIGLNDVEPVPPRLRCFWLSDEAV